MTCLAELPAYVAHGANGVCGPPSLSLAAATLFVIGVACTLALWRLRARSALLVCVLFALPGWWILISRHVDDEPVTRLRVEVERFSAEHGGCVVLESHGCEACDPIVRRARTPSASCAAPAAVELHEGALGGHCVARGTHLVCGPN